MTLGPPIAALAAIGVSEAWRQLRSHSPAAWLLPIALFGTALVQAHIVGYYGTWSQWLVPLVVGGAPVGASVLLYAVVRDRLQRPLRHDKLITRAATSLAIGALLVAPAVWSGYSTLYGSTASLPSEGPRIADSSGGFGGPGGGPPAMTHSGKPADGMLLDGGGMPGGGMPGTVGRVAPRAPR